MPSEPRWNDSPVNGVFIRESQREERAPNIMRATVLSPRHISVLLAAITILGLVLTACGDGRNTSPPPKAEATAEAPGPGPTATAVPVVSSGKVDGYLALAPAVLRSGQTEHVSVSLFSGNQPAVGDVRLALLRDGRLVAEGNASIEGTGSAALMVPSLPTGTYELQVQGPGFKDTTLVQVRRRDHPVCGDGQAGLQARPGRTHPGAPAGPRT